MYNPTSNQTRIAHIEDRIRERQEYAMKAYDMANDLKRSDVDRETYLTEARVAEGVAKAMLSTLSVLFDNE